MKKTEYIIDITVDDKIFQHVGRHLFQYDKGYHLLIMGIEDTDNIEVHFSEYGSDLALIMFPDITDEGGLLVKVPDILVATGKKIRAYLYRSIDKDTGVTLKVLDICILKREKPENYVEPEQEGVLEQLKEDIKKNYVRADEILIKANEESERTGYMPASNKDLTTREYLHNNMYVDIPITNEELSLLLI